MAEQNWEAVVKEPYDEDRAGMTVVPETAPGYVDGPGIVFHSDWWLREHWGRAFEILEIDHPQAPSDGNEPLEQNFLLARKRPVSPSTEELERVNPNESRELESLRTNVRVLLRQSRTLHKNLRGMQSGSEHLRRRIDQLEPSHDRLRQRLDQRGAEAPSATGQAAGATSHSSNRQQLMLRQVTNSRSWRLTAPLRTLAGWARKLRARTSRARSRSSPDAGEVSAGRRRAVQRNLRGEPLEQHHPQLRKGGYLRRRLARAEDVVLISPVSTAQRHAQYRI